MIIQGRGRYDVDECIQRIVTGITPDARDRLVSVLGEAMNVWENRDIAGNCEPDCRGVVGMTRLAELLSVLRTTGPDGLWLPSRVGCLDSELA